MKNRHQHLCGSVKNELIVPLLSFGSMAISQIIARPSHVYFTRGTCVGRYYSLDW